MNNKYSDYLELPDTIPKRVYDLAAQITEGYDNNYDKVKALEQYLVKYPYTLKPENVPSNRDFVDYFLFDAKEGYCTYYATSLAVMCRTLGIPTRYVEGYVMPNMKNMSNAYTITNYQAHAWVEVYFKGFGWVPFEATAPYNYSFNHQQLPVALEIFSSSMMEDYEEYDEYIESMGIDIPIEIQEHKPKNKDTDDKFDEVVIIFVKFLINMALGIIGVFLFILSTIFLHEMRMRKIYRMDNRSAVLKYFKYILKVTKAYGYPIRSNETAFMYANRLGKRFAMDNERIFMFQLVTIFSKASYSNLTVTDNEKEIMYSAYNELLEMIALYKMNKPTYILYHFVLGRF